MTRLTVLTLAALAGLALPALAEGPFTHEEGVDHFGYYFLPEDAPMVGPWAFDVLHIGFEFDEWEKGERTDTYAPVMVSFNDTSSPQLTNEMGGTYYENSIRVLPTSYAVTADSVSFAGESDEVGEVRIEAKFLPGDEIVLVGDVTYGGQTLKDVTFSYFGGD